jgi:peptidyl-tRNA hydrolase
MIKNNIMKRFWRKNKKEKVIMAVNKMLESEHSGQLTLSDLDRAMAYYKNFHSSTPTMLIMTPEQKKIVDEMLKGFNHE